MSDLSTTTSNEVAAQPLTIAQAALALFSPLETDVQTLAERYRDVAFDMSTPKGFKSAKEARLELRESGRFAVQRLRDKTKDQLNDCKKVVDGEATRLIEIVEPVEAAVDEQIKVHEKKLADEKAERDRKEAERAQRHLDAIAKIERYVTMAEGLPIERIEAGLAYVREIDVSAEVFEDFTVRAQAQKDVTIRALEKIISEARERAAAEALRIENERLQAQLDEMKRKQDAAAAPAPAAEPEPEPLPREQQAAAARAVPVAANDPAPAVSAAAPDPLEPSLFAVSHGTSRAAAPETPPTLSLGQITERLGVALPAAFLRTLGFEPAARERGAVLYHERDYPRMCDALVRHVTEAKAAHAQRLAA